MPIDLVTKFAPYTDEQFAAEGKKSLLTNNYFDWTGAHTVKVFRITTAKMNDYDRSGDTLGVMASDAGSIVKWSRYGEVNGLDAETEEFTLKRDRSFTFATDKLDEDETANQLMSAHVLAMQTREVVIPEVDSYTYRVMCESAGYKPEAVDLTAENLYGKILEANEALDDAEVPETGRVLVLKPATYTLLKKCKDVTMETEIGNEMRLKGVVAMLDGCSVVKVPAVRLPAAFGFMVAHPCATVAPTKLEEYTVHENPPGISGSLVEGRICYDAFVLENKKKAIFYQAVPAPVQAQSDPDTGDKQMPAK